MSARMSRGQWLRHRYRLLDLSREELARRMGCAVITLYKIESGERRPSQQIAGLLAQHLNILPEDRAAFTGFMRGTALLPDSLLQGISSQTLTNLPVPPSP